MRHSLLIPVCLGIGFCIATAVQATDAAPPAATIATSGVSTTDVPQTLELGAVEVRGKLEVSRALLTIKQALKAPDSTDAAHRDDLVCRFVHEIANPQTYLDCATNATNMARRSSTQMARLAAVCTAQKCDSHGDQQSFVATLVANQPGQRLHILVNPFLFKKMMADAAAGPQAPPATATAAVPAAATTPQH